MKNQIEIEDPKIKVQAILKNNIQKTLDSIANQIAVIDNNATIIAVNREWKIFADQNGLCSPNYCIGENYIEICKKASEERKNFLKDKNERNLAQEHIILDNIELTSRENLIEHSKSEETPNTQSSSITEECKERLTWEIQKNYLIEQTQGAQESLKGIEQMLSGEIDNFSIDYPCHSPDENRWFRMSLIRFVFQDALWIMISHENITNAKLAELNLIKSENKLKGIIQSVPDAMCMIDRDQNIVWVNDVAEKLYGSSLVGKKCYRAYGRWNNLCQNCIVHKTFRDGNVHSGEYAHFDIDGNERILFCTASVAGCDASGNISHVMEIMRDITEKKRDEKFLKFMQIAVDTIGDGVYWINPDGSIKYVNQSVLKYTGYTEEEFKNLRIENIDPNITESSWSAHWNELRRVKTMRFETIHRTKDGVDIPFEVTASHVIFDRGDEHNFAVVRNISERKQAEREIRRLSQAVEYSPVSVVITDIKGSIEYVNRKFSQVTGYTREEAIGQNPRILSSGQIPDNYYKKLWSTILSGEEWKGEFVNKKKSGEIYWESASISPVIDEDGKIAYFVAVKEDTTARKKIMGELKAAKQKAESATQAKSEFLATMSHEIRTPMNAIIGMSHLMMDTELNDTQYGYLSNIQSAADSLLSIINDILDLSKIEAGKMEFESIEFEWNQIIERIFNVLKFNANEKKLELIYSFGKNIPQFMAGDPTRLGQVIMNLVGNAVKYTSKGEVAVHTEVISEDKKTITLRVSIKDTGIGISESTLSSLFKPFTQVDSSISRKYGGTGLGLVIAKRIVNRMGGDIEVQSVLGKGSIFSFTVVLNKIIQPSLPDNINSNYLAGINVMVVEPHINSRRALATMLKSLNIRVMAASNGEEAIQLMELAVSETKNSERMISDVAVPQHRMYEKPAFDLVIINAELPINSIGCAETIKSLEAVIFEPRCNYKLNTADCNLLESSKRNLKTKYIVMHNFAYSPQAFEIAEQVRVDDFLSKPVTPAILMRTILNVINMKDESSVKTSTAGDKIVQHKMLQQNRLNPLSAKGIQEQFSDNALVVKDKHILVVDDDEINQQIVVTMLKKVGIETILTAFNGEQAVKMAYEKFNSIEIESSETDDKNSPDLVADKPFDLILMDVEMPVMDGLEATSRIRKLGIKSYFNDGAQRDVPIIALTGHALDEYRKKCFKAGMNDHIDKPIQPERLFAALQKWLR
ncbi:MAG: PAS domain S-box protein [Desulfamplus sp.]|nr:PAS domain S-box protein [Desulfamplus sp.]